MKKEAPRAATLGAFIIFSSCPARIGDGRAPDRCGYQPKLTEHTCKLEAHPPAEQGVYSWPQLENLRMARKGKKNRKDFRAYFTRNGKRYYAKDYGYKAWPF